MRVPALASQMEAGFMRGIGGERHAQAYQPLDRLARMAEDVFGGGRVAQTCAGNQRVFDVFGNAVGLVEHGGDAALRPLACAIGELALGHQGDLVRVGQLQGQGHTSQAAAQDQYIVTLHDVREG